VRRLRRTKEDVKASIDEATRASEEAAGRLAEARDLLAVQKERARSERVTIIAALKRMRAANNLAGMILDTVEQQTGEPGETGGGAH
jgi:hypothetical protein